MPKRKYTHRKGNPIPVVHDSLVDIAAHLTAGTPISKYKTKMKKGR